MDDRKFLRQRERLVEELREKGIEHEGVLAAIAAVPRHRFVEQALRARAYRDEALPIGMRQTISQPFTVAYQTMLLDTQKGDRVLEVGTGSGYQAAVLCEMGARVFSIERHKPLLERTQGILKELGYHVVVKHGDGTLGWESLAPFDGIVVTAGAREIPSALLYQLRLPGDRSKRGGRLVIPVGSSRGQVMTRLVRRDEDAFDREEKHVFRFVPLVGRGGLES